MFWLITLKLTRKKVLLKQSLKILLNDFYSPCTVCNQAISLHLTQPQAAVSAHNKHKTMLSWEQSRLVFESHVTIIKTTCLREEVIYSLSFQALRFA